jgi:crotonobetainyl-CoA:carnitine CoA-transferase CaiB-like acyl-CoA transferase
MTEQETKSKSGPLPPYRVLDLTDEKGFMCGKILGDLGADVVKVEPPGGDKARNIGPFYHDIPDPEKSLYWFALNSNKRGITLDIRSPDGSEIFKKLVKTAAFVVESFTPGYMSSLGLSYEGLSKINPRLIMTSITPFGQKGPKAKYKASELTCWASGGAMYIMGDRDRPPNLVSYPQAYALAGAEGAAASMIAHYYRQLSGEGQHVDVSIQQCVVWTLLNTKDLWSCAKYVYMRTGYTIVTGKGVILQQGLPCKDGYVGVYIMGGAPSYSRSMYRLVEWMDEERMAPEWLKKIRWEYDYDASRLSQELVDRVEPAIADFLMTKTKTELYEQALSRELLLVPINDPREVSGSPELQERAFWETIEHPELGECLTYCGPFAKLSETPMAIRRRAPLIGEHNEEIYQRELGLSAAQSIVLKEAGVI